MEFKTPEAELATMHLKLNTFGSVIISLDVVPSKEIDEMCNDENGDPTPYGFILKKIIDRFEEFIFIVNDDFKDLVRRVDAT